MSFGCLAETSQTVSTSEIQLLVEFGKLDLSFGRLQPNLLDTAGSPDAFKGLSGRLHRNQFFCLGICKEFSINL
jgi:hypothetical protein